MTTTTDTPPSPLRPADRLLVRLDDLALLLSLSERHIERLDASAKLPGAIYVGKAKCWSTDAIRRWIEAKCPDRAEFEQLEKGVLR